MMITITSMKKLQEPDLLLNQPRNSPSNNPHNNRYAIKHNLSRTGGRLSPRHSPKNRRIYSSPGTTVPIPLSSPDSSTSSTFTTSTIISSPRASDRLTDSLSNNHLIIDGLDDDSESCSSINDSSRCTRHPHRQYKHPHRQYHSSSQGRSESLSNCNSASPWIRSSSGNSKSGSISSSGSPGSCPDFLKVERFNRRHWILLSCILLILLTSVITFFALTFHSGTSDDPLSPQLDSSSSRLLNNSSFISSDPTNQLSEGSPTSERDETEDEEDESSYDYDSETKGSSEDNAKNLDLKEVSRISWNLLNSNQERGRGGGLGTTGSSGISSVNSGRQHKGSNSNLSISKPPSQTLLSPASFASISGEGEELVLPSKMIFTSGGDEESEGSPGEDGESRSKSKKRSCCRTQKYSQVIKRDGCEPLTITNRMCFGQCVSVWVPGLFASFPVCRPSRSSWKTVTLNCGKKRDRKRRVRIEKVQRCSCMEIESTVPSQMSGTRR